MRSLEGTSENLYIDVFVVFVVSVYHFSIINTHILSKQYILNIPKKKYISVNNLFNIICFFK